LRGVGPGTVKPSPQSAQCQGAPADLSGVMNAFVHLGQLKLIKLESRVTSPRLARVGPA